MDVSTAAGLLLLVCVACVVPCLAADDHLVREAGGGPALTLAGSDKPTGSPVVQAFPVGKRYVLGTVPLGSSRTQAISTGSPARVGMRGGATNPAIGTKRWYPPSRRAPRISRPTPTPTPTLTPSAIPHVGVTISQGVEIEPGLYRFSAAEVQAIRKTTPYEWAQWAGPPESRTSLVDPMRILGMYPLLRVSDGFVLRAYVTNNMMGGSGTVFALPVEQSVPPPATPVNYSPSLGTDFPPGADLNFTEYIQVDGSPASYLEAVVCAVELRSFAEFWHWVDWRAMAFLDSEPAFNLTYTGPEPAIWPPTVRVGPSETVVVFHTLSDRTGTLEEHTVRFTPGTRGCEWSRSYLAFGGPGYTP